MQQFPREIIGRTLVNLIKWGYSILLRNFLAAKIETCTQVVFNFWKKLTKNGKNRKNEEEIRNIKKSSTKCGKSLGKITEKHEILNKIVLYWLVKTLNIREKKLNRRKIDKNRMNWGENEQI